MHMVLLHPWTPSLLSSQELMVCTEGEMTAFMNMEVKVASGAYSSL